MIVTLDTFGELRTVLSEQEIVCGDTLSSDTEKEKYRSVL